MPCSQYGSSCTRKLNCAEFVSVLEIEGYCCLTNEDAIHPASWAHDYTEQSGINCAVAVMTASCCCHGYNQSRASQQGHTIYTNTLFLSPGSCFRLVYAMLLASRTRIDPGIKREKINCKYLFYFMYTTFLSQNIILILQVCGWGVSCLHMNGT